MINFFNFAYLLHSFPYHLKAFFIIIFHRLNTRLLFDVIRNIISEFEINLKANLERVKDNKKCRLLVGTYTKNNTDYNERWNQILK